MELVDLRALDSVGVYKGSQFAGTLSRTAHGATFSYNSDFRLAAQKEKSYGLAFSLSPESATHEISGTNLHPFFAGLLPEGLRLKALRMSLKTSEDDLFSMLLALGTNCIGDVYVQVDSQIIDSGKQDLSSFEEVSFFELFNQSISATTLHLREADPGIPGVFPKLSASMISFPVGITNRNRQYLLKLGTEEHPQIVRNEHFFMSLAKHVGFLVPKSAVVRDRLGVEGLLVERFDRVYTRPAKSFLRLHQEDACQILNRYPQDKYRLSMREIAAGIAAVSSAPLIDTLKLIELYLFSYLIGNGDLHGKNISLIHEHLASDDRGRIRLSPSYDLLSTLPYGDRQMALRLGAKNDSFTLYDFVNFGKLFSIPENAVKSSAKRIIQRTTAKLPEVAEIGLEEKKSRDILKTFEQRVKILTSED